MDSLESKSSLNMSKTWIGQGSPHRFPKIYKHRKPNVGRIREYITSSLRVPKAILDTDNCHERNEHPDKPGYED